MRITHREEQLLRKKYEKDKQMSEYNTFFETHDNWSGNYRFNNKEYVAYFFVNYTKIPYYKDSEFKYKMVFKGNDDIGLEKYYKDIREVAKDFKKICSIDFLSMKDLKKMGFVYY